MPDKRHRLGARLLQALWRGILNPASFVALLAPIVINRTLWVVQMQIGDETRGRDDPLYVWVHDPKFLGLADYTVQVYSAVLSSVFFAYVAIPFMIEAAHHFKQSEQNPESNPELVAKESVSLFGGVAFIFIVVAGLTLLAGGVGRAIVLDKYLHPESAWRIWFIELPPFSSPLTWIRFGVYAMSVWATRIVSQRKHVTSLGPAAGKPLSQ